MTSERESGSSVFVAVRVEHVSCGWAGWPRRGEKAVCGVCGARAPDGLVQRVAAKSTGEEEKGQGGAARGEEGSLGVGPPLPRALVVRPTLGGWEGYSREALLHVGLSDSRGRRVFNFDERGALAEEGW